MPNKAKSHITAIPPVSGSTTLIACQYVHTSSLASCAEHPGPISSATAESVPPSSVGISAGKSLRCRELYPDAEIVMVALAVGRGTLSRGHSHQSRLRPDDPPRRRSVVTSTGSAKDCSPYWSDCIVGDKLDVVVAHRDRLARFGGNSSSGWSLERRRSRASAILNQPDASPESDPATEDFGSTFSTRSVAGCTGSGGTETLTVQQSRRIKAYPNQQHGNAFINRDAGLVRPRLRDIAFRRIGRLTAAFLVAIATWLDASRWTYHRPDG